MSLWDATAELYRQHLRRYAVVRVTKEALFYARWYLRWRVVRPLARAVVPAPWLGKVHRLRGIGLQGLRQRLTSRPVPLVSQSAAVQRWLAGTPVPVFPASHRQSESPQMQPQALARGLPPLPPVEADFPPVVVHQLHNATVAGRTSLVALPQAVVHHDLMRLSHDYTSEELHGRITILPRRGMVRWYADTSPREHLAHAVAFTDAVSANYAHWLTEVLPRLHAYALARPDSRATALFDAGLHPNLQASIDLVLPATMPRRELATDARVRADLLEVVSAVGYIPFDRRAGGSGHSHGAFSAQALSSLRAHLLARVGPPAQPFPRRVLLRRSSIGRALVNEQALEDALRPHGFAAIYPERLSFTEQVQLFREAEMVVGATGATMASSIFCPPQARIVICFSAHPAHSFNYWQAIAGAVGNRVQYVLGRIEGSSAPGVHSNFSVEPSTVLEVLGLPTSHPIPRSHTS